MGRRSREINYFRVGTFVITGIILLVLAILIIGSGMLFKRYVYVETYFGESVQGLVEGSPVKYLGMEIGHVVEINSVDNVYHIKGNDNAQVHRHFIYVKMAINPKFFAYIPKDEIASRLKKDIANGLRFKLAPQGLTGNVYVEMAFLDPKANPVITLHWQPENIYIPSAPSTLAYFSDNVQLLLEKLKKINLQKFFADTQRMINSTNQVMYRTDRLLSHTNSQIIDIVNNLNSTSENFSALSEQAKAFPSNMFFGKPPPALKPGEL